MKSIGMAFLFACVAGPAMADDCIDPLIKKPEDAGHIAFVTWRNTNPAATAAGEKEWLSHFTITLSHCVWVVAQKPIPPRNYSTFAIDIQAEDGRVLGVEISD